MKRFKEEKERDYQESIKKYDEEKTHAQNKYKTKKAEFEQKAFEAANLDALRKQMEEMQQIFEDLDEDVKKPLLHTAN